MVSAVNPKALIVSDDESLEDHSGIEDFNSVTLEVKKNKNEPSFFLGGETTEIPQISITPMTPPGEIEGHCNVSLGSSSASPLPTYPINNFYWRSQSPIPPKDELHAQEFFAYRNQIVQNVIEELRNVSSVNIDGNINGTWLLTEIDHWDNEKERIVFLCQKSLIIIKYDFIAMKKIEFRRILLTEVDKLIHGELEYPPKSFTPKLNGLAGGLVGVVKDCLVPKVSQTVHHVGNAVLYKNQKKQNPNDEIELAEEVFPDQNSSNPNECQSKTSPLSLENFEAKSRNVIGLRIMWNQDEPLSFTQKWNPFTKSIPYTTFTSHPLLWHSKSESEGICNKSFDIDTFFRELIDTLSCSGGSSPICRVEYKPIIIETYVGIASLFHNANSLGFYKVRGKFSF